MQLDKKNVEDILPLTPTQEGMLFHYLSNRNGKQYLVNLLLTLTGTIDFKVIKNAWRVVAGSNEVLRSVYRWEKLSKPVQIILRDLDIPVREYDFRGDSPETKRQEIKELSDAIYKEGIDISTNPIRISLCRTDEHKCLMMITNHHILFDGWSNGIIYQEFLEAYHNLLMKLPVIDHPKVKYKEFVKCLLQADIEKEKAFWSNYLESFETKSALPYSTFKLNNLMEKTSVLSGDLNQEFTDSLHRFTKQNGITPAAVIYSAWGILLQMYSATKDVVFGTTVSGRNQDLEHIDYMVGLFINTIPLRIGTSEEDTVLSFLNKVADDLYERKEYEHTSLTDIVEASKVAGGSGLFDSVVVVENYPLEHIKKNTKYKSLVIDDYEIKEMTNYDLTLTVMFGDSIQVQIAYNDEVFDPGIMKNLSKNYLHIVKMLITNPDRRVRDVDFLCEEERRKVLGAFNDTACDYQREKLIHMMFEEQVEKTPNKVAVVCGGEQILYDELNRRANCLAWELKEHGVGRDHLVGIMVRRSADMLVGMLGAMKAGAAYLPIDPDYPRERVQYVLEHSGCSVMLTQTGMDSDLGYFDNVLCVDQLDLESGRTANPETVNTAEDLIYLIYTSGSTGNPKGVMLSHRAVHNFINGTLRKLDFHEDMAIVSVTTISFDIFVLESLLALTKGLKIVMAKEEEQRDPKLLDKLMTDNHADILQVTPSRMKMMLESGQLNGIKGLKKLLIGGEPFPEKLLSDLSEIYTGQIYNMYGPTETTVWSTIKELSGQSETLIGRPIDNTQIYILGEDLKPAPIGVNGELYIGGDGLSRGYFNDQELTDSRFIQNPFDHMKKLYKTGDLAKWTLTGELRFIGRNDTQIKLRGYRIELGEIEAQLRLLEGISNVAVVLKANSNGDDSIWAFIVSSQVYTQEELSHALAKRIPYYMVPSQFITVPQLPMTLNGKIDKNALAFYQEQSSKPVHKAPEDEIQHQLADIWAQVLGVDREKIGVTDRFFDIGGNSLNLVRVHLKIDQQYPGKCEMVDLFSYNTIRALADFIVGRNSEGKSKVHCEHIKFPTEYLCEDHSKKEMLSLRFDVEKQLVTTLKDFAANEEKTYIDVLMVIYLYLINEVTGVGKVSIQAASDKRHYNSLMSIQLDFNNLENFSEALELIVDIDSRNKNSYELKQLLEWDNSKEDNDLLPLFYVREYFDFKEEYSKCFDLALCTSYEEEGVLVLKYNCNKVRKEKAKEFLENYLYLMEAIACQYRVEKSGEKKI